MPRELRNAKITHVSYVDKAANKKRFLLTKSEDGNEQPTFEKEIKAIAKTDSEEQRLVYGIVYEPDELDAHGDFMTSEEIEKAAHQFLKDARNVDKQHNFQKGYGEVVESYIAPQNFQVGEETVKKGSWVLVTKASEEIWNDIKNGKITGYSMAGTAEVVEKSSKMSDNNHEDMNLFKQFVKAISHLLKQDQKQIEKDEEEIDMKAEDIKKMLDEALKPLSDKIEALEVKKEEDQVEKKDENKDEKVEKSAEEIAQEQAELFKSAIEKALKPLEDRLEKIEKARGNSTAIEKDGKEDVEKSENVFDDLFKLY